jgi:transposase, IS5 family
MPRRVIGQETLGFDAAARASSLEAIHELIDWAPLGRVLGEIYAAERGEAAWPPLMLFKALLLAVWHDLSDVRLGEALEDRASFRRFCGFSRFEPTPERTAFVRFRRELVARGLDRALFQAVTDQLRAKAVMVKTGTLVDATVIGSASKGDAEAGWSGHRARKAIHGYKAHVAADRDSCLVDGLEVTPGNVHEGRAGTTVIPEDPGEVFADSAYRGTGFAQAVHARGGVTRVATTHYRGRDDDEATGEAFAARQRAIQRVRSRIEKIFGTWKRSYGLRRMRWRGLGKAALQVRLTATAYNLRRALTILSPA